MQFFKNLNKMKEDSERFTELAKKLKSCVEGDEGCLKKQIKKKDLENESDDDKIIMFEQGIKGLKEA